MAWVCQSIFSRDSILFICWNHVQTVIILVAGDIWIGNLVAKRVNEDTLKLSMPLMGTCLVLVAVSFDFMDCQQHLGISS